MIPIFVIGIIIGKVIFGGNAEILKAKNKSLEIKNESLSCLLEDEKSLNNLLLEENSKLKECMKHSVE